MEYKLHDEYGMHNTHKCIGIPQLHSLLFKGQGGAQILGQEDQYVDQYCSASGQVQAQMSGLEKLRALSSSDSDMLDPSPLGGLSSPSKPCLERRDDRQDL